MSSAKMFQEKRAYPRVSIGLPVKYRLIEDPMGAGSISDMKRKEIGTRTLDVSQGGMYISSDQNLSVGSILSIQFSLPGKSTTLSAFGEVVWSNNGGGGIHFLALKEEDRESLGELLARAS